MSTSPNQLSSSQSQKPTAPTLQTMLKRTTTPGKREYFSFILFIAAGIEGIFTLIFSFFIVPQLTMVENALGEKESWSSAMYLILLGILSAFQIGYGVYLRRKKEQDSILSAKLQGSAIIIMILSFFIFSFLVGQLLISVFANTQQLIGTMQ